MHEVNNSLKIHSQSLFGFLGNLVFPLYVSIILDNFDLECLTQISCKLSDILNKVDVF